MPSDYSPSGHDGDRPEWRRDLADHLGEDPGRFLDQDLLTGEGDHPALFALARIRGIDSIERVNAWIAVERRLDRGPRDAVIERLEDRREFLEEVGERPGPDECSRAAERSRRRLADRDLGSASWTWLDQDGEPYERSATYYQSDLGPDADSGGEALATDGGESDQEGGS